MIGEGNGTPLQHSCLEYPMDGGAWWAAVHGVAKSRTQLSDFTFTFHFHALGEGNGNPLQCSCLENPRDRGAWWAAVCGVTQSRTRLKRLSSSSNFIAKILLHCGFIPFFNFYYYCHINYIFIYFQPIQKPLKFCNCLLNHIEKKLQWKIYYLLYLPM